MIQFLIYCLCLYIHNLINAIRGRLCHRVGYSDITMDMGNFNNISRTTSEERNSEDDDIRERDEISVGYNSGDVCSTSSQNCIDFSDAIEHGESDFSSEDSQQTFTSVSGSRSGNLQSLGTGFIESTNGSTACFIEPMCRRIESLGLCARTVQLHRGRIAGIVTGLAAAKRLPLNDYLLDPQSVVADLNELYISKKYKANSIKSIYASIRHYILALCLEEAQSRNLLNHYDSEMAKFEKTGLNDVSTYKQDFLDPKALRQFVLDNYNPSKNFSHYITGLIYSQYPLRDDLTNIYYYKVDEYTKDSLQLKNDNYIYDDGTTMCIKLNKTKTIPRVYPPISLPLDEDIAIAIRSHPFDKEKPVLRGRRSVILKTILNKMNIVSNGGAINFIRRSHAKDSQYSDIDTLLFVMGHSAKTHGRHYL